MAANPYETSDTVTDGGRRKGPPWLLIAFLCLMGVMIVGGLMSFRMYRQMVAAQARALEAEQVARQAAEEARRQQELAQRRAADD